MIVENKVLEQISKFLEKGDRAYFEHNTLWLQLEDETKQAKAAKIFYSLAREYEGRVRISPTGYEYAIDFI